MDTLIASFLGNELRLPEKLCLGYGKTRLTYSDVAHKVRVAAKILADEYAIKSGDYVMISGLSLPDYVVALLASQYLGAVTVPVDKLIKKETLSALIDYLKPSVYLAETKDEFLNTRKVSMFSVTRAEGDEISISPRSVQMTSVAEMLFTTGTTGLPKGAMLGYNSIRGITRNTIAGIGMRKDDVVLIPLPLNHSVGMRVLRSALTVGASVVLQNGFAFAQELEENIKNFACTGLVCVPTSIEVVQNQMQGRFVEVMSKLRYIEFGAGSLNVALKKKLVEELPQTTIFNTWGSSETGGAIFLNVSANPTKHASLGKPVEGVEFATLREDGSFGPATDAESAGRMALRGDMRMLGYYNLPDETANAIRGEWLVTNDLAYSDVDGFIYMLGRADDIINVGGEKVAPVEVENIAQTFEGIRECACIGVPDKLMGQVPALYYVPEAASFDIAAFEKYMAIKAERYQVPKHYIRIAELPRNRMSKLDRKALKKLWKESLGKESIKGMDAIEAMLTRKSVRDFSNEPIPKEMLEMILRCAIQAPSAHNMQTWRFTVITKGDLIARFKELLQRKAKDYKAVCYGFNNPAAAILITNDARNRNAAQDSACAAENMMLAAHALGLGSVWNNTISYMKDDEEVRSFLNELSIPARHQPWLLLLLGHPSNVEAKSPQRRQDVVAWVQ